MKSKINILIAALILIMASCRKEEIVYDPDEVNFRQIEISMPLAKIEVPIYGSMNKHIDFDSDNTKLILIGDEEGKRVIAIRYSHSEKIDWSEEISVNDKRKGESGMIQSIDGWTADIDLPPGGPGPNFKFPSDGSMFRMEQSVPVSIGIEDDSYFDLVELLNGSLQIYASVPRYLEAVIEMTIPQLKDPNGIPFKYRRTDFMGSGQVINDPDNLLAGYTIEPTQNGNDRYLDLVCDFSVEYNALNLSGPNNNQIEVQLEMSKLLPSYIEGYFGQMKKDDAGGADKRMDFDFFEFLHIAEGGEIGIKDMTINMKVTNPVGMPARLGGFMKFGNNDGWSETLKIEGEDELKFDVDQPPYVAGSRNVTPVVTEGTKKVYTPSTSTDHAVHFYYPNFPTFLEFDFNAIANPDGQPNLSDPPNFVVIDEHYNPTADIEIDITVPFYLNVKNFTRTDTVGFNYREICQDNEKISKSVKKLDLYIDLDKYDFPLNVIITLIVVDDNYKPIKEVHKLVLDKDQSPIKNRLVALAEFADDFWGESDEKSAKHILVKVDANTEGQAAGEYKLIRENQKLDISVRLDFAAGIPLFQL